MRILRAAAVASISAIALAAAACTPAADTDADAAADEGRDTTTIIEREVPAEPVVIEREVPADNPPVVIEDRREGDSTTVRAGENGIEVETTNR